MRGMTWRAMSGAALEGGVPLFFQLRDGQGLTLVHFSAQPEPFLTPKYSKTPRNTPLNPRKQPLNNR